MNSSAEVRALNRLERFSLPKIATDAALYRQLPSPLTLKEIHCALKLNSAKPVDMKTTAFDF